MRLPAPFAGFLLLPIALLALCPAAAAGTEAGWSTSFGPQGMDGKPLAAVETDAGLVVGGDFQSIGSDSFAHIALYDGETWHKLGSGFNSNVHDLIIFDGQLVAEGTFTASGATPLTRAAWWNGSDWLPLGDNLPESAEGLVDFDGELYCGGWRWDGSTWMEILTGDADITARLVHDGQLIVTGEFTQVNGVSVERLAAWDGAAVSDSYPGSWSAPVMDVEVHEDRIAVLAGWYGYPFEGSLLIWNDSGWDEIESPHGGYTRYTSLALFDGMIWASVVHTDGLHPIYYTSLHAWNGVEWSDAEAGTVTGQFEFLYPLSDGILIGGRFSEVNDIVAHNLAALKGTESVSFDGTGLGADKAVLDFCVGTQGLLIGGWFDCVGGTYSSGVVLRDGDDWVNRGMGHWHATCVGWRGTSPVAMAHYHSDIPEYAYFYWVGSGWSDFHFGWQYEDVLIDIQVLQDRLFGIAPARIIEIEGGVVFTPLAEADEGQFLASCLWNDRLVVGGGFTGVGGVPADRVAEYDGSAWSAIGDGLGGTVRAVADWDGLLTVGGHLSVDGRDQHESVAVWCGESWTVLDGVFDDVLETLTVYDGSLYAGGRFTVVDGAPVAHVARWDGTSWQPLGEGVDGWVYALAVHDDRLWVGGDFDHAGGHPAQNLCTWIDREVPIYLQEMTAVRESAGVRVNWSVSGEGGTFILARVDENGASNVVSEIAATGLHHEVLDAEAPAYECRYSLALRTADGVVARLAEALAPATVSSMLRLARPMPNPFNPATHVAFSLPRPGHVAVTVHDVLGRRVATLVDETRAAGEHTVAWRGCDDAGHAVASGTYVVCLRAEEEHRTVKAVLIR